MESLEESKAIIISDWIQCDENFGETEFLEIIYNKGKIDNFKLNAKIFHFENNALNVLSQKLSFSKPHDSKDKKYEISSSKIAISKFKKGKFKIIFEILYYLKKGENSTNLEITFQKLSIGDPCFLNDGNSVCKNLAVCRGFGPKKFHCDCKPNFGGEMCQFKYPCYKVEN